jgi:hypothetical protein
MIKDMQRDNNSSSKPQVPSHLHAWGSHAAYGNSFAQGFAEKIQQKSQLAVHGKNGRMSSNRGLQPDQYQRPQSATMM